MPIDKPAYYSKPPRRLQFTIAVFPPICYNRGITLRRRAMKFFHLSDLHLGLKLLGRDLGEDDPQLRLYLLLSCHLLDERDKAETR